MIEDDSEAQISAWLAEHLASGRIIDFRLQASPGRKPHLDERGP
jgi:hypothetical protein